MTSAPFYAPFSYFFTRSPNRKRNWTVFCILYRDLRSKPITPFWSFRPGISEVSGDKPAPGATLRHLTPDCHKIGPPDFKFNSKSRARADERNIPPRQAVTMETNVLWPLKRLFPRFRFCKEYNITRNVCVPIWYIYFANHLANQSAKDCFFVPSLFFNL